MIHAHYRVEAYAVGARTLKRFRCPRGHEQDGDFRVTIFGPTGKAEHTSGPLCRRCYFDRLVDTCETAALIR